MTPTPNTEGQRYTCPASLLNPLAGNYPGAAASGAFQPLSGGVRVSRSAGWQLWRDGSSPSRAHHPSAAAGGLMGGDCPGTMPRSACRRGRPAFDLLQGTADECVRRAMRHAGGRNAPATPLSGGCRSAVHIKTRTARAGGFGHHRCTPLSAASLHKTAHAGADNSGAQPSAQSLRRAHLAALWPDIMVNHQDINSSAQGTWGLGGCAEGVKS